MQIFGKIPFIKPHNYTSTTDKRFEKMKNERKRLILFWLNFCSFFFFFFFFFFFAKHTTVGRLFRNSHPSLQYSSHSRIHIFICFSSHVHPALCLDYSVHYALITVCTIFLFKLFTIEHFGG